MRRELREQQMLAVAIEVFGEVGFHAANMDIIAERCGITKPLLYRYFGSKRGLYLAVLKTISREIVDRLEALTAIRDPEERLVKGGEVLQHFLLRYNAIWAQSRDFARSDREVAVEVDHFRNALLHSVVSTYVDMRPKGVSANRVREIVLPYVILTMGGAEAAAEFWLDHTEIGVKRAESFANHINSINHRMIMEALEAEAKGVPPAELAAQT